MKHNLSSEQFTEMPPLPLPPIDTIPILNNIKLLI